MTLKTLTAAAAAAMLALSMFGSALAIDQGGGGGGGGGGSGGGGGGSSSSSSSSSSSATNSAPTIENARTRIAAGNYSGALVILADLIKLYPNDADVFNLTGYSLRKLHRYEDAERFYLHALQLDPHHTGANEYLGELYVETGRLDMARQRLAALQSICGSCEAYEDLAEAIADAN